MFGMMGNSKIQWLYKKGPLQIASKPVTAFAMNQYLIACVETKKAALLDCGDANVQDWVSFAAKEGGFTISSIMQTHAHVDHLAGLHQSQTELKVPVHIHEGETVWLKNPMSIGGDIKMMFPNFQKPELPEKFIEHGEILSVGNVKFKALHTPGHTPGHVVYYSAEAKVAFTGDLIFEGSVGRTDFPHCDSAAMQKSLALCAQEISGDTVLFSGHGNPTTMEDELRSNPFLMRCRM